MKKLLANGLTKREVVRQLGVSERSVYRFT